MLVDPEGGNIADIKAELKRLEDEERRYAKELVGGLIIQPVQSQIEKLQNIDFESVANNFRESLTDMPYEDKLFTVRKIVDKVIATKERVTICGQIPVLYHSVDARVGLYVEHRFSRTA